MKRDISMYLLSQAGESVPDTMAVIYGQLSFFLVNLIDLCLQS